MKFLSINIHIFFYFCCFLQGQVDLLKNKFGFDEAFNYKEEPDLDAALKRLVVTCMSLIIMLKHLRGALTEVICVLFIFCGASTEVVWLDTHIIPLLLFK